jgi:hypothetical protein
MIKVREIKNKTNDFDSLVVEIPKDFAISQGLPERSIAMLTVKNGKIESEVIPYSDADIEEADQFLEEFPEIDEKLRKLGD